MKNKKGFTLIELLAVIIILGVLMIIAIPSVTKYIDDSRKNGYVSTAKSIAGGARNLIYSGELGLDDKTVTYYIDGKCINTDNGYKSPYGELEKAYVAVVLDGDNYEYYWMSVDDTNTGVATLKNADDLENSDIVGDIDPNSITPNIGIDGRKTIIKIEGENCTKSASETATRKMNTKTGKVTNPCPEVTETIYWALQNPDSSNHYQKLVLSDSPVSGGLSGNFPGNSEFTYDNRVPWNGWLYYITDVEIIGTVAPLSTVYWFGGLGAGASMVDIDLSELEVCNVTNMHDMFSGAGNSSSTLILDLSGWDTSNVTNMAYMFSYTAAYSPTTVSITGLKDFDVSSVVNTDYMFDYFGSHATNLSLDLSNWDLSNVESASHMFQYIGYYSNTLNLTLNNINFAKLTDMSSMFYTAGHYATNVTMNLKGWNTSNATNMKNMFNTVGYNATSINIDLSGWDTSKVTNMVIMFCYLGNGENISTLHLNISDWNLSKVEDMYRMFESFGGNAQDFSVVIPKTNGNGIDNTTSRLYGKDSSVYSTPPNSYNGLPNAIKPFTLAS